MTMLKALTTLATTALFIKLAMAANYTVGGQSGGWDTSTNVQTWASSQTFYVGDNLIFQYSPNHDVLEVTKADYDSCLGSSPLQTHSGGTTSIPLSSPGKRYFICGTAGHCSQGMKMEVTALATSTTPPASQPKPSATPPTASPPNPSATPPASPPKSSTPPVASKVSPPATAPSSKGTARSPGESPMGSPTSSPPVVPSTESPTSTPLPSSANKAISMAGLSVAVCFVVICIVSSLLIV